MTVNGFKLPDSFVKLCQEIREGKAEPHWLLKEEEEEEKEVDAYGNRMANPDIEFLTDPESIKRETDELGTLFGNDGRFEAGPEDASSPGFVELTSAEHIVWFGTVASGEPFCFDFGENPGQPSVVTWNDAYWQRVAPDFDTFLSLFVPWSTEEDDRRFGGTGPAPAVTEVPHEEHRKWMRTGLDAEALAIAGKATEGHACLLSALHRAEELRDNGEPWGAKLVRLYKDALDRYARLYGARE